MAPRIVAVSHDPWEFYYIRVWRIVETQYVDNSVETVENREMEDTGGGNWRPQCTAHLAQGWIVRL